MGKGVIGSQLGCERVGEDTGVPEGETDGRRGGGGVAGWKREGRRGGRSVEAGSLELRVGAVHPHHHVSERLVLVYLRQLAAKAEVWQGRGEVLVAPGFKRKGRLLVVLTEPPTG